MSWALYLFYPSPEDWRTGLEYALAADNPYLAFYLLMALAAIFNAVAIRIVLTARTRKAHDGLLVGSSVISAAYLFLGAWKMSFIAALPIWYVYKARNEV
jgi:hypothetical protein